MTHPVLRINGNDFIPVTGKAAKPIVVDGKTYVPVHTAPEHLNVTAPIYPKQSGHVDTFKIGNKTYVPVSAIPRVFRPLFKPVLKAAPKPIIKINDEHYIPVTGKAAKPIVVEGKTYIPVIRAPESANVSKAISPTKEGPINTFKIGNKTYIPLNVIPKVNRAAFKPVKKSTPPVIAINDDFYIPVKKASAKPVVINGRTYIPVTKAPETMNITAPIYPKKEGAVNTFKIGNKTYIPLDVVPKVFRPAFKPGKKVTPPVIAINGEHFVPVSSKTVKPIVVEGRTYIPVKIAPGHLDVSSPI